jgi:hypothetical protein
LILFPLRFNDGKHLQNGDITRLQSQDCATRSSGLGKASLLQKTHRVCELHLQSTLMALL